MDFQIAVVVFFVFVGSLTRATFGFGEAIVAMPLLTLVCDIRVAAALVAVTSIFNASVILATQWRRVEWQGAWRLVVSALVGIPLGVAAYQHVPLDALKLVLALVVIGFASYNLLRPPLCRLESDLMGYVFGLISGVLGGAYNALGPPLVIYGTLRGWGTQKFRSTLQAVFLPASLFVGMNHYLQGLWTREVFSLLPFCLPAMVLAAVFGNWLNDRFESRRFLRCVHFLLLAVGVMLVLSVLMSAARPDVS